MKAEVIVYGGVNWRRYPNSKRRSDRVYYKTSNNFIDAGMEPYLHRQIWRDANGPIQEGCHIHHRDGNTLNNDLSNLQCMTYGEHRAHHVASATEEDRERARESIARIRPAAAKWHGSKIGREWHKVLGVISWMGREPTEQTCEHCGKAYQTLAAHGHSRFCSNACKTAWRLRSGLDDEQRVCLGCGSTYTVNKNYKQSFCSRPCAWTHRKPRSQNKK